MNIHSYTSFITLVLNKLSKRTSKQPTLVDKMANKTIEHRMTYDLLHGRYKECTQTNFVFSPSVIRSNDGNGIKKLALKEEDIPVVYLLHFIFQNDRIVIGSNLEKKKKVRLPNEILYLLKELLFEDYYKMIHKMLLKTSHHTLMRSIREHSSVYTEVEHNIVKTVYHWSGNSGFTVCPQCGNIINTFNNNDVPIQITNQVDHKYCIRRDLDYLCQDLNYSRPHYYSSQFGDVMYSEYLDDYDDYDYNDINPLDDMSSCDY